MQPDLLNFIIGEQMLERNGIGQGFPRVFLNIPLFLH
jgi:hypothetical protein